MKCPCRLTVPECADFGASPRQCKTKPCAKLCWEIQYAYNVCNKSCKQKLLKAQTNQCGGNVLPSFYIPFFSPSSCWEKWAVQSNTRVFVQKLVYCRGENWWPVRAERQVWWKRIGMHQNGPMEQRKISKGEPTSLRMEGSCCGSIMFSLPSGKTQKFGQWPEMLITSIKLT